MPEKAPIRPHSPSAQDQLRAAVQPSLGRGGQLLPLPKMSEGPWGQLSPEADALRWTSGAKDTAWNPTCCSRVAQSSSPCSSMSDEVSAQQMLFHSSAHKDGAWMDRGTPSPPQTHLEGAAAASSQQDARGQPSTPHNLTPVA